MVGFKRVSNDPYRCDLILIPIEEVMLNERKVPAEYINERGNDVLPSFIDYIKGIVGDDLPEFLDIRL